MNKWYNKIIYIYNYIVYSMPNSIAKGKSFFACVYSLNAFDRVDHIASHFQQAENDTKR